MAAAREHHRRNASGIVNRLRTKQRKESIDRCTCFLRLVLDGICACISAQRDRISRASQALMAPMLVLNARAPPIWACEATFVASLVLQSSQPADRSSSEVSGTTEASVVRVRATARIAIALDPQERGRGHANIRLMIRHSEKSIRLRLILGSCETTLIDLAVVMIGVCYGPEPASPSPSLASTDDALLGSSIHPSVLTSTRPHTQSPFQAQEPRAAAADEVELRQRRLNRRQAGLKKSRVDPHPVGRSGARGGNPPRGTVHPRKAPIRSVSTLIRFCDEKELGRSLGIDRMQTGGHSDHSDDSLTREQPARLHITAEAQ